MNARISAFTCAALLIASVSYAQTDTSLAPYAGSYSGVSVSTNSTTTLSDPATLRITGSRSNFRGSILYTGILARFATKVDVLIDANVTGKGRVRGTITAGNFRGTVTGKVRPKNGLLRIAIRSNASSAGFSLTQRGRIRLTKGRAAYVTNVASNDPGFPGRQKSVLKP